MFIIPALISVMGCASSNHEKDGEHESDSEQAGHLSGHEEGGGEGEESGQEFAKDQTYDQVRNGARLMLAYDGKANAFVGTVENTTDQPLSRVRVEVHLSSGIELGPTTPTDLAPGQKINVELKGTGQEFDKWSAHPEIGSSEHGEEGGHDEGGEQGEAGEHGKKAERGEKGEHREGKERSGEGEHGEKGEHDRESGEHGKKREHN